MSARQRANPQVRFYHSPYFFFERNLVERSPPDSADEDWRHLGVPPPLQGRPTRRNPKARHYAAIS
jgi:hypothetical protein